MNISISELSLWTTVCAKHLTYIISFNRYDVPLMTHCPHLPLRKPRQRDSGGFRATSDCRAGFRDTVRSTPGLLPPLAHSPLLLESSELVEDSEI